MYISDHCTEYAVYIYFGCRASFEWSPKNFRFLPCTVHVITSRPTGAPGPYKTHF